MNAAPCQVRHTEINCVGDNKCGPAAVEVMLCWAKEEDVFELKKDKDFGSMFHFVEDKWKPDEEQKDICWRIEPIEANKAICEWKRPRTRMCLFLLRMIGRVLSLRDHPSIVSTGTLVDPWMNDKTSYSLRLCSMSGKELFHFVPSLSSVPKSFERYPWPVPLWKSH